MRTIVPPSCVNVALGTSICNGSAWTVPLILAAVTPPVPLTVVINTIASLAGVCPPKLSPVTNNLSPALYPEPAWKLRQLHSGLPFLEL